MFYNSQLSILCLPGVFFSMPVFFLILNSTLDSTDKYTNYITKKRDEDKILFSGKIMNWVTQAYHKWLLWQASREAEWDGYAQDKLD